MGRIYAVPISAVSVSAAVDLWEILAPSTSSIRLHGVFVAQSSDTDSEQLRVSIRRVTGAPTSGSGGSSATPAPLLPGDAASGATAETCNTTQISGGTSVTLHEDSWNVLGGFAWLPTPELRPVAAPSTRFVVAMTAPADAVTVNGTLYFEELA